MDTITLNRIIDASINAAVKERSSSHPILPVARAVNLAFSDSETRQDRSAICRLVCERALRYGMVLQFCDE